MTESNATEITYARRGAMGTLTMRGALDIFEAERLCAVATRALQDIKATTVQLNCSAVDRLDISTLQVLLALKRDLQFAGRTPVVVGLAAPVESMLERLGISL